MRLFSLKENGTRHERGTPSSLLGHTAIPLFCVRFAFAFLRFVGGEIAALREEIKEVQLIEYARVFLSYTC